VRKVLRISRRCDLPWDALAGEGPRRSCTECRTQVHLLDDLTADEIHRLIETNPAGFCGAYRNNGGGEFVIPQSAPALSRSGLAMASALLASVLSGCSETALEDRRSGGNGAAQTASAEAPRSTAVPAVPSDAPSPSTNALTDEQREALAMLWGYIAP
jgi:hypothetical protein